MLNPLKIASDGYLKKQTKAALVIAVAGYLNFAPSNNSSGSTDYPTVTHSYWDEDKRLRDEYDWAAAIECVLKLNSV